MDSLFANFADVRRELAITRIVVVKTRVWPPVFWACLGGYYLE